MIENRQDLSSRQRVVYEYLREVHANTGRPATIRRIADHFGISVNGAYGHIRTLRTKGWLVNGSVPVDFWNGSQGVQDG